MTTIANTTNRETSSTPPVRLMSLDALRGFDMFWIVGAEGLLAGLRKLGSEYQDNYFIKGLTNQLEHVEWAGFHFEDLIFPLFVFMAGMSLVYSLQRTIEQHGRAGAMVRIFRRGIALYLLGIFHYGGFSTPFAQIRLLGVLQRIAICYTAAGLIFVFCRRGGQIAWCVGLLVGYWALLEFVPVPGGVAGDFSPGHNLTNWIDMHYLPLRKWDGAYDPEGLLSTLPAISNCLIGMFAGLLLRDGKQAPWRKAAMLAVAGAVMIGMGWLWHPEFPVIKKLWTSSFVLVACGYSCLLLATFYQIIDVCGWKFWAMPFVWIGMNSIFIFMMHSLVKIRDIAERFVGGDVGHYLGKYHHLAVAVVSMLLTFGIARFLYVKKVFIRL